MLTKSLIKLAFSLSDVLAFAFVTLNEIDKTLDLQDKLSTSFLCSSASSHSRRASE